MKILFVDQSSKLGGAQLCLLDIDKLYQALQTQAIAQQAQQESSQRFYLDTINQ